MSEPKGIGEVHWISTEWLNEHLEDPELIILDTQPDIHDYIKAHIPGARYLNEKLFRIPLEGIPGKWIPPEAAQTLFRRLGLDPNTPTVVYTGTGLVKGWGDGLEQTMVAYTLLRFGHRKVYILDGGFDKWLSEGRPTSQIFPHVSPTMFTATLHDELAIDYETFKQTKDQPDVILLDARPANIYAGEGPWIRNGHIPGAINLPWKELMDPDNPRLLRPEDEIRALLAAKQITPDKRIICSCGTGREATNEFLLFKHFLGYPHVVLYEGSFTEWSAHPENPVVQGPDPY